MPKIGYDTTNCDREPIHIPGSIQPHGVLLVLDKDNLSILQVSNNTLAVLGVEPQLILGRPLEVLIGAQVSALYNAINLPNVADSNPFRFTILRDEDEKLTLDGIAHMAENRVLLELEPTLFDDRTVSFSGLYHWLRASIARLQLCRGTKQLADCAVSEIRELTGFDRVMIYKFDPDWHGSVIAEAKRDDLQPYLGLHYPASDIPSQARELYTKNWLRLIPDVNYTPSPLMELPGREDPPLDMTQSALRSVSPIHRQYLRNMGVTASMSVSILRGNELWGLIACHHETPRYVSYDVRSACEFVGQTLSTTVEVQEATGDLEYAAARRSASERLVRLLDKRNSWFDAFREYPQDVLKLVSSQGVALCSQGRIELFGETPTSADVIELLAWLRDLQPQTIYYTSSLSAQFERADKYRSIASGVMAITISPEQDSHMLWFRPEVVETVNWAGDPNKPVVVISGAPEIHPRKSFELWKETVSKRATPWIEAEIIAAIDVKNALVANLLQQTVEELRRSNEELDSFAHVVSRDLRAPLRALLQVAGWIQDDLSPQETAKIQVHLNQLQTRVAQMDALVEGLLQYSQVGRNQENLERVSTGELVSSVITLLPVKPGIKFDVQQDLPELVTKRGRIEQVFLNLIGNAIKHHDKAEGLITISAEAHGAVTEFTVSDDGPGIEEIYHDRIFGLFETLGSLDRSQSPGIGLALVKRIVENEGGSIRLRSAPGAGSAFTFSWPSTEPQRL